MELRVLEYFLALTREGSVSAAAKALNLSQPTLSRQLIELERELGTTLFERGRQGIALTEDGMLLRRRAAELVDLARITESEIMAHKGVVTGEIRIGCAETRAVDLVAAVMSELHAEHPQVTYRVTSGVAEEVAERVEHGLLDFGLLLRLNERWSLGSLQLPSNERPVAVLRASHPLAEREVLSLDDIAAEPLLAPASWEQGGLFGNERPRPLGGRLNVVAYFDMPYNATRMVCAGMGIAILLAGLVEEASSEDLVVRPLDLELSMPSYLVWKPFQLRTRACEAFLERMKRTYAKTE